MSGSINLRISETIMYKIPATTIPPRAWGKEPPLAVIAAIGE